MLIIGYESFKYTSKKDNLEKGALIVYFGRSEEDDTHKGITSVEKCIRFNYDKDYLNKVKSYYENEIPVYLLYRKNQENAYDFEEIPQK